MGLLSWLFNSWEEVKRVPKWAYRKLDVDTIPPQHYRIVNGHHYKYSAFKDLKIPTDGSSGADFADKHDRLIWIGPVKFARKRRK